MLGGEERSAAERVARERIALESGGVGGTARAAAEPQRPRSDGSVVVRPSPEIRV